MTPFTHSLTPLSSPLTLYVYEDEGAETLTTSVRAAAGSVIQLGNQPKVKQGQGRVRKNVWPQPSQPLSKCGVYLV